MANGQLSTDYFKAGFGGQIHDLRQWPILFRNQRNRHLAMSTRLEIRNIDSIAGQVSSGFRTIKDGKQFDKYFPKPEEQDRIIIEDGEVSQTVDLMKKVVWKYIDDTKKIAPTLSRKNLELTCKNIWTFLYQHIQYRLDKNGLEQLRRPARSWHEREEGIDCDCFSIFASSILTNLGIPHSFRITKYNRDVYQHVYVIVPNGKGNYIIDPVLSKADYEKPFSDKKDFPMSLEGIDIAVLSGTGEDELYDVVMATDLEGVGMGDLNGDQELDAIYRHLVATRNSIIQNPDSISFVDDPQAFLKMVDYAITHWNTPNRDKALEILAENENKLNLQSGISGIDDELEDEDDDDELLGRLFKRRKKKRRRGFFTGIKKAVKGIGKGLKKVGKVIIRFNPVSIAARSGFLLSLKLNYKKMASKLKWAYATKQQAARKGVSESRWESSKKALAKVERLFSDKLQGKRSALKKAILKGKAGNLNGTIEDDGLSGLGEPVTAAGAATLIATASPIIVAVMKILKQTGLEDKGASEQVDVSEAAIKSAATDSSSTSMEDIQYSEMSYQNPNTKAGRSAGRPSANKAIAFLKNNPMVAVGGVAAIGGIGYLLFANNTPKKTNLSGTARKGASRKKTTPKSKDGTVKVIKLS